MNKGKKLLIQGYNSKVSRIAGDLTEVFLTGTETGLVSVWNLSKHKKIEKKVEAEVTSLVWAETSRKIGIGCKNGVIEIVSIDDNKRLSVDGHYSEVNFLLLNKDQSFVYSAGSDKTIKIWDFRNMRRLNVIHGHKFGVLWLTLMKNEDFLISCSCDNDIIIWNTAKLRQEAKLEGHISYVNCVVLNLNETQLFSAGSEGVIKVWDLFKKRFLYDFKGHSESVNFLAVFGGFLVSCSSDKSFRLWNLSRKIPEKVVNVGFQVIYMVKTKNLVVSCDDFSVRVLDPLDFHQVSGIVGHSGEVVKTVQCGDLMISAGEEGYIKIWNIWTSELISSVKGHNIGIWDIDLDPHSKSLYSCGKDSFVHIWSISPFSLKDSIKINTTFGFRVKVLNTQAVFLPCQSKTYSIFNPANKSIRPIFRIDVKKKKEIGFSRHSNYVLARLSKHEYMVLKMPKLTN